MAKDKLETKKEIPKKTNSIKKEVVKKTKIIYIGPNLYNKGLTHGKVFDYEPKHLIKSMPEIRHILIPIEEFTKNKILINKKGSKYDFLIKEFQASLIK